MGRRTLLLIAAFLVAALGTSLVFLYVQGVDERAQQKQRLVEVLVATAEIPVGTTGAQAERNGAFDRVKIAQGSVAKGALSDTAPIKDLVAVGPIFPGEQILAAKFGQASTGTLPIPEGRMAVSVQLSDPARVAGFVGPGSEVAVFLSVDDSTSVGIGGAGGSGATGGLTAVLLPRVQVLAAGQSTTITQTTTTTEGEQTTEQLPRAILTLALNQEEATKVVQAQRAGELYFGLLTEDSAVKPGEPIDAGSLFR